MPHHTTRTRPRLSPAACYVTVADLDGASLVPADVATLCPGAVEYIALDGSPVWLAADLDALTAEEGSL